MKEIYEMKGAGRSIRGIAGEPGIARNTVRRYLKSPEAIRAKPGPHRASKLDPYTGYVDHRLAEGLENCVVLHRELRARGYDGGYSILKDYVSPRRRPRHTGGHDAVSRRCPVNGPKSTGAALLYIGERRQKATPRLGVRDYPGLVPGPLRGVGPARRVPPPSSSAMSTPSSTWAGCPRRCLYADAKVITLGRDEEKRPVWNRTDAGLRPAGWALSLRLCQPIPGPDQGQGGEWREVRPGQPVAQRTLHR